MNPAGQALYKLVNQWYFKALLVAPVSRLEPIYFLSLVCFKRNPIYFYDVICHLLA